MKKLISFALILAMLFAIMPLTVFAVSENTNEFAGGDGTETNPYLIATKEHLNNVRNYLGAHFKMIADIKFSESDFAEDGAFYNDGKGFEPIGESEEIPFNGTFDGDGHVIKNTYINIESSSTIYVGLFGNNEGVIKNLGIVDGSVTATSKNSSAYAGGIVGRNYRTITNCYNTGSVTATSDCSARAGGISGENYKGTILNCYNTESVTATSDYSDAYAGGISGENYYYGTIKNCYNTGSVKATGCYDSAYAYAGGITGYNRYYETIANCYNTGSVKATDAYYTYAGGIAGYNRYGTIENCYNIGSVGVIGAVHAYASGIAGKNYGTIENCYNTENVAVIGVSGVVGNSDDAATKCTLEQLKQQSTFVRFDFETVWTFDKTLDNHPYPVLRDPGITIGDINGNETITSTDYIVAKRAVMRTYNLTEAQIKAGDVNGDGLITSTDYIILKRHVMGTYVIGG